MDRFKVVVTSDEALEAVKSVWGASIPTIGPALGRWTSSPEPGYTANGDQFVAVLEAENESAAENRIRELVGPQSQVSSAEPWPSD